MIKMGCSTDLKNEVEKLNNLTKCSYKISKQVGGVAVEQVTTNPGGIKTEGRRLVQRASCPKVLQTVIAITEAFERDGDCKNGK